MTKPKEQFYLRGTVLVILQIADAGKTSSASCLVNSTFCQHDLRSHLSFVISWRLSCQWKTGLKTFPNRDMTFLCGEHSRSDVKIKAKQIKYLCNYQFRLKVSNSICNYLNTKSLCVLFLIWKYWYKRTMSVNKKHKLDKITSN